MRNPRSATIEPGWQVFARDGSRVGAVGEVGDTYLLVQKGLIFQKDLYIPQGAIARLGDDEIWLNVGKDDMEGRGWDEPPSSEETIFGETRYGFARSWNEEVDRASPPDEKKG